MAYESFNDDSKGLTTSYSSLSSKPTGGKPVGSRRSSFMATSPSVSVAASAPASSTSSESTSVLADKGEGTNWFYNTMDKMLTGTDKDKSFNSTPIMGIVNAGLGIYNTLEQRKMNKFMKDYYGNQQAVQMTDFANAARSSNEALRSRQASRISAQGIDPNSAQGQTALATYMQQWGANTQV